MTKLVPAAAAILLLLDLGSPLSDQMLMRAQSAPQAAAGAASLKPEDLDRLFAPVALYPDQLLAQMLLCAANPGKVGALEEWLASQTLKGSELQDAAVKSGFEPSFVALALFPDVVHYMAQQPQWTAQVGQAFAADRNSVFASIQRLRAKAQQAGKLKSTPQQDVETKTTSSGQQVIVIEPSNPQVVYVPQYNPSTVYTPTTSSTVVIKEDDDSSDEVAAGLIGFTAGIALGAAIDNDYYYGPYGWYGGGYMYNDAWDRRRHRRRACRARTPREPGRRAVPRGPLQKPADIPGTGPGRRRNAAGRSRTRSPTIRAENRNVPQVSADSAAAAARAAVAGGGGSYGQGARGDGQWAKCHW